MERFFYDKESPDRRKRLLGYIFEADILSPEGFLDQKAIRGKILDLGSGKGVVGAVLKSVNPEIELVGIDIIAYPEPNYLDLYADVRAGDIAETIAVIREKGEEKFDLVVGYGLPPEVIEGLIRQRDVYEIVKPGGLVLLIFDVPISVESMIEAREKRFRFYRGTFPNDYFIMVWYGQPPGEAVP